MRHTKYIGVFCSNTLHEYNLTVYCDSFVQAFILLTAEAINQGKHYQLATITDEKGNVRYVKDISLLNDLLK